MGLNDLTLEKLIGEINGYKLKMQTLYEDYGRAAQDLQDRINVLGYNLNEQLKDVKDSISSTPQRLLTLETKYVSGEVTDSDYRVQRSEFKSLLQHNLHTIEDIKSMINVLSAIEARPLGPAEIRQQSPTLQAPPTSIPVSIPSSLTPRAYGPTNPTEDRNRPNSFPERPAYVAQLPTQQPAQEQAPEAPVMAWTTPRVPTQPVSTFPFSDQPSTATEQVAPPPTSTVQPEVLPLAETQDAPKSENTAPIATAANESVSSVQERPEVETLIPQPTVEPLVDNGTVEPIQQPISIASEPTVDVVAPATVPDQAVPSGTPEIVTPAPEVPETPQMVNPDTPMIGSVADDAMMVKVVDDIPVLDASAVATGAEAQLQSPLMGGGVSTESIAGAPATSDIAQVSPSQPNAFYNVVCPKCGADVRQPAKVWELKGGKSKKNVLIGLFQCQDCRVKFREALTREII